MKAGINKIVKLVLVSLVAYVIISKIAPIKVLLSFWQAYSELNPSTKIIINVAGATSLLTILFCLVGCLIQLRRKSLNNAVISKIKELEKIVYLTKSTITVYEQWLLRRYYYVDSSTVERLAPTKWILTALEHKLEIVSAVMHIIPTKKLDKFLDMDIELNASPIDVLLFSQSCSALPEKLSLKDCARIIKRTFASVKNDLAEVEAAAAEKPQHLALM